VGSKKEGQPLLNLLILLCLMYTCFYYYTNPIAAVGGDANSYSGIGIQNKTFIFIAPGKNK